LSGSRTQRKNSAGSAKGTIYLLRHGEITGTKGPIKYIGQTDRPLSPVGRAQAQWWSQKLSDFFFEAIYACDLKRSRETAKILAAGRQIPIRLRPGLREIDLGQWEKRTIASVRMSFPDEFQRRGQDFANYRPPGGESFADLRDRVVPTFESIARETQKNALIVGHAGVNRMILCHVLGLPVAHLFRIAQDYGCLNMIEKRPGFHQVTAFNWRPETALQRFEWP
jgi:alpha-ribazole phosphatase